MIDLDPAVSVIRRAVDAAGAAYEISPDENVAIRIDRQRPHVKGTRPC